MIKLLLFFKKKLPFLWKIIELFNGFIFKLLYKKKINSIASNVLLEYKNEEFTYRFLEPSEKEKLYLFFQKQNPDQFQFFKPHGFDKKTIERLFNNSAFFLFGVFNGNDLAGYFFLRCFINKKSFTGRIVDEKYQGHGISRRMGKILHNIAWESNFRVFGTASKENIKSLNSYKSINNYKVIRELDNNFIYFEYLKNEEKPL